ncbi:Cobyrinic acid a,c-diamide synthase [Desulforamulus reducens MI-1]|uniref:Cobyrinic acid a,c-diamide synthase n=1 Tax=Desulforamulus reducens (strain ATCC BAA-1160 / DSM 100696 / MI-1) TaxID=349161 RepID=A4J747_DESRM|nr:MinD/ParA family protein [Desulforamulus reducens]ABO50900.1 Cobyrinic acid a,c-diamide synthase [Desulforamulus reducens MI-1]
MKIVNGHSGARVIAVTSGKGGVGKSNLVVNLAVELTRRDYRVAIFDADLGMANAEVLLGIVPQYTLYDYLFCGKDMAAILTPSPQGVSIISGGSGFVELANLDTQARKRLGQGLEELDYQFDFVLVDTGAGISKTVLGFVAAANEVIVVITPEPTSLTDGYGLIKVLSKYNVHNEVMLVVNKATDEKEALRTFQSMESTTNQFLKIRVKNLGFIPEDKAVVKGVKSQKPYITLSPSAPAAKNLSRIVNCLISGKEEAASGVQSFFGKLMRLFR